MFLAKLGRAHLCDSVHPLSQRLPTPPAAWGCVGVFGGGAEDEHGGEALEVVAPGGISASGRSRRRNNFDHNPSSPPPTPSPSPLLLSCATPPAPAAAVATRGLPPPPSAAAARGWPQAAEGAPAGPGHAPPAGAVAEKRERFGDEATDPGPRRRSASYSRPANNGRQASASQGGDGTRPPGPMPPLQEKSGSVGADGFDVPALAGASQLLRFRPAAVPARPAWARAPKPPSRFVVLAFTRVSAVVPRRYAPKASGGGPRSTPTLEPASPPRFADAGGAVAGRRAAGPAFEGGVRALAGNSVSLSIGVARSEPSASGPTPSPSACVSPATSSAS
mmetsp:Transcript_31359/g.91510  ORF Transcript_31359/g.91510 Transcript_31359/m.91510 type:complete len:334 (-) Transcript_31359:307-1308(-)